MLLADYHSFAWLYNRLKMENKELANGWRECLVCGKPVPPIEENLTGFGEVYPDPYPICEDCIDTIDYEIQIEEMPF